MNPTQPKQSLNKRFTNVKPKFIWTANINNQKTQKIRRENCYKKNSGPQKTQTKTSSTLNTPKIVSQTYQISYCIYSMPKKQNQIRRSKTTLQKLIAIK